jgi:hypothetical protein
MSCTIGVRTCDSSCTCKLDILIVSVKYVLVSVELVYVYAKLLKIYSASKKGIYNYRKT